MGQVITLLTDFGTKDSYVAQMKGVILSKSEDVNIVDAGHEVDPQNIKEASLFLSEYLSYYPKGSIHVCVVDPGVGSTRKIIVADIKERIIIAPDNGLISCSVADFGLNEVYGVDFKRVSSDISSTFHGRDLFAPIAAEISKKGLKGVNSLKKIKNRDILLIDYKIFPEYEKNKIVGQILKTDKFGNIITTIKKENALDFFNGLENLAASIASYNRINLEKTYSSKNDGEIVAIWNSLDRLEIAIVNKNAKNMLDFTDESLIYLYKI